MEITFLGTSSATPTRTRSLSAAALQLEQRREWWLFDCGEGTQHQILRSDLSLSRLTRIFITHLHGDHIYGLPGLLASRSLAGSAAPVILHGPKGLFDFLSCVFRVSNTHLNFPLEVRGIESGSVYEDRDLAVAAAEMKHGGLAFGYAITEKPRPGTFDVQAALALGIPSGPIYGQLKRGETVELEDGRRVQGAEFVGPPRRGRKVVFTGDTRFSKATATLAREADVLVHEATYLEEDHALAAERDHSTAAEAARTASLAGVRTLILTHLSPRYEQEEGTARMLKEARAIFENTLLARDLWTFRLPPIDRKSGTG